MVARCVIRIFYHHACAKKRSIKASSRFIAIASSINATTITIMSMSHACRLLLLRDQRLSPRAYFTHSRRQQLGAQSAGALTRAKRQLLAEVDISRHS